MKNRVIEIDEIKEILPHRYPFLLVDRVLEIWDDGIRSVKNVTVNEPFFQGHFPVYPVMPGVLIVEAMAQNAGIYGILKKKENGECVEGKQTFFTSIDGVKFKRQVRPGDRLILEAIVTKIKMGIWWFDCKALVDDEVVCVGQLSAIFK